MSPLPRPGVFRKRLIMGLGSIVPGLQVFDDFVFCQRQVSFNSFLGSFQIFFTKSINQPMCSSMDSINRVSLFNETTRKGLISSATRCIVSCNISFPEALMRKSWSSVSIYILAKHCMEVLHALRRSLKSRNVAFIRSSSRSIAFFHRIPFDKQTQFKDVEDLFFSELPHFYMLVGDAFQQSFPDQLIDRTSYR